MEFMKLKKTELKNCPFCGSENVSINMGEVSFFDITIHCENCSVTGPSFDIAEDTPSYSYTPEIQLNKNKENAIKHWNSRHQS